MYEVLRVAERHPQKTQLVGDDVSELLGNRGIEVGKILLYHSMSFMLLSCAAILPMARILALKRLCFTRGLVSASPMQYLLSLKGLTRSCASSCFIGEGARASCLSSMTTRRPSEARMAVRGLCGRPETVIHTCHTVIPAAVNIHIPAAVHILISAAVHIHIPAAVHILISAGGGADVVEVQVEVYGQAFGHGVVDERHAHEARGKRGAQRFGCVAGLAPQEVGRGGVRGGRREERAVEGHAPLVGAALVALVLNLEICHARLDVCACADLLAREAAVVVQVVHIPLRRVVIERGVAAGAAVVYDLDIILVGRHLQQLHAPALVHKVLRVDTVHQTHGRYAVEVECRHAPPYGKVVELLEVHDNGDFTTPRMCCNGMSLTPLRTCGLSWGRVRLCGIVSVLVGLG